ncbi:hypothetical protein SLOPH_987, partial [Spraguea lophii 42_110]
RKIISDEQKNLSTSINQCLKDKLSNDLDGINFVEKVIEMIDSDRSEFNGILQTKCKKYDDCIDKLHNQTLNILDKKEKDLEVNFRTVSDALKDDKSGARVLLNKFLTSIKRKSMRRIVSNTFTIDFHIYDNFFDKLDNKFNIFLNNIAKRVSEHKLLSDEKQKISKFIISSKMESPKDIKIGEYNILIQEVEDAFRSLNEYVEMI